MYKKVYIKGMIIGLFIYGIICINACDSLIPDDFDKQNLKMEEWDAQACIKLSRPFFTRDTNNVITDTNFVSQQISRFDLMFDSTTLATKSEGQIIMENYQSMLDNITAIIADTMVDISFQWDKDNKLARPVFFAKLNTAPGNYVFYVSWQLDEKNQDAFVEVDVINSDSSYTNKNTQMTISSTNCSEYVRLSQGHSLLLPKLRGRFEMNIQSSNLVRFEMPNPLAFKQKTGNAFNTFQLLVLKAD